MDRYSTGEMAKEAGVTVRTVQFYDGKGLLHPSSFSQGGRREYGGDDLSRLKLICLLKSLGLSLDEIRKTLEGEDSLLVLSSFLDGQERMLDADLKARQEQKAKVVALRECITKREIVSLDAIGDFKAMSEGRRKLSACRTRLVAYGILLRILQFGTFLWWIFRGDWRPFALELCYEVANDSPLLSKDFSLHAIVDGCGDSVVLPVEKRCGA